MDGSTLTVSPWKPPCWASYFRGASTNLLWHQFPNSSTVLTILFSYVLFSWAANVNYCHLYVFSTTIKTIIIIVIIVTSQEAFWCLVMICDKYIPGYYSPKLVSCCSQFVGIFVATALKSSLVIRPQLFEQWIAQYPLDNSINNTLTLNHWILLYAVDSANHPLNNWGQVVSLSVHV